MTRGTTPENTFKLPFELDEVSSLYITYSQAGKVIVEKDINNVTIDGDTLTVKLTQIDTLSFSKGALNIQIRFKTLEWNAMTSSIINTYVDTILKEEVI